MSFSKRAPNEGDLRRLLLAAAALAGAGTTGCPSEVVDGTGGSGGSRGVTVGPYSPTMTGPSGGGATPSGGGAGMGPWCQVASPDPADEDTLLYVCTDRLSEPCPAYSDPDVSTIVRSLVMNASNPGCGYQVDDVVCGPDPGAQHCCYVAAVSFSICEGRPFTQDGAGIVAPAIPRADWRAPLEAPVDEASLDPATRAALAQAWVETALAEHASVASFARAALELLALGAPADLVRGVHGAMGDEIEHAALAFTIASEIGGSPVGPGDLAIHSATPAPIDPTAVAYSTMAEGCINETLSACLAIAERDSATDLGTRAALERIAADEVEHAALAWRTLAWLVRRFGAPARRAAERALVEARPLTVAARPLDGVDCRVARAFGRLPRNEAEGVLTRAFSCIVRPAAEALLAAPHERRADVVV